MSWLLQTVLWWPLGYMCLFQFWFPQCVCPAVGLLGYMAVLVPVFYFYFFKLFFISWRLITLQYCSGYGHTLTWICHGCTCAPHPEPPSHLLPHPIPQGHPSAPAPSTLYHALNLDWHFISHMIIYMFQCHSPISSCPRPLPQSPKDCSLHLCLFCCLAYMVIVTICLNSIYLC